VIPPIPCPIRQTPRRPSPRPSGRGQLPEHRHAQGQLGIPLTGTMTIVTPTARWLVPPGRGIWTRRKSLMQVITVKLHRPACWCLRLPVPGFLPSGIIGSQPAPARTCSRGDTACPRRSCRGSADRADAAGSGASDGGPAPAVPLGRDPRLAAVMRRLIDEPDCPLGVEALGRRPASQSPTPPACSAPKPA
jgi:hypothetical protein